MKRSPTTRSRGVAVVAVIVLLLVVDLVIVGVVLNGGRDQTLTVLRLDTEQAYYATEAGINMAIREIFESADEDGDGGIGSISDDGNAANNPTIGTASVYVQASTAGTVTTVLSRSSGREAHRHATATLNEDPSSVSVRDLLFVVPDATSLGSQDLARQAQMEAWGYTVTPISASDSQALFDAAVAVNDLAYISEEVNSGQLNTKIKDATIGIVSEERALNDDFGISSGNNSYNQTQIDIQDNSHYITFLFSTGLLTIATSNTSLIRANGTLAGGAQVLAERVSSSSPSLIAIETGGALYGGGSAAGRRVMLPFGGNPFDFNLLNSDGLTIMRRSVEWAAQNNGLVGHWQLDEGAGTTTADNVGSNDATITNGTWTTGVLGNAVDLNGSSGSISIPNAPNLQMTDALTIAGWVNADSWGSGFDVDVIARKGDGNPNNYQLAIDNSNVTLYLDGSDNSSTLTGDTTLNTGRWYHVAATWNGSEVNIYLDGALDHSPAYTRGGTIGIDTRNLYIGGRGSNDVFDDTVDDVRIYNRALSAAEVAALSQGAVQITSWQEVEP